MNYSALSAAWICWALVGLSPIMGKYAAGLISPAVLVFLGTLLGVLYFTPWVTKNYKWGELFSRQTLGKFLFIGTFGTALPFTVLLIALHYTTPGNAAILQQSELIYSLIFAAIFLREFPSKGQLGGSALIVLGVLIILLKEQYTPRWMGDLLIVGSTWMLQAGSTQPFTFRPTATSWIVLGYTGFLKYGLAMVVWYKAIRALDLSKVTAIYLSYPVLSLLLSALLGLDKITPHQLLGLAITCAGAYWVSLTVQKEGH